VHSEGKYKAKKCTDRYRRGRKCTQKEKDEDKKYALFDGWRLESALKKCMRLQGALSGIQGLEGILRRK